MFPLVTKRGDATSDHVVLEPRRRGEPYARLNTEDLCDGSFAWRLGGPSAWWTLTVEGRALDLREVRAANLRRPAPPTLSAVADTGERAYATGEWMALLEAPYAHLDGRWLNPPAAMALAEDKPRQLTLAAGAGSACRTR